MIKLKKPSPVSKFLKEARIKSSLTQAEVANALRYKSVQFVSNWERGLRTPPGKTLVKLAKMYRISIEDLYDLLLEEKICLAKQNLKKMLYG